MMDEGALISNKKIKNKLRSKTDATRLTLIRAGVSVFSRKGYDGASNRLLAKKAGVNLALISYHFGGKRGLYFAVIRHVSHKLAVRFAPAIKKLESDFSHLDQIGTLKQQRSACLAMIKALLIANLELLLNRQTASWAMLVYREQQLPSKAFSLLYNESLVAILTALEKPIAFATQRSESDPAVKLLALSLLAQVQLVRSARHMLLQHMEWETLSDSEVCLLKKHLSAQVDTLLSLPQ
ncbi:CerR family C-terminal domain-containing protein [Photobacterium swingsii]|uniref:CerR family C-terminal domain-containing protein n=1 Tax=Photobacterium swingsii TaxID=680026 RepID=UPI004068FADE